MDNSSKRISSVQFEEPEKKNWSADMLAAKARSTIIPLNSQDYSIAGDLNTRSYSNSDPLLNLSTNEGGVFQETKKENKRKSSVSKTRILSMNRNDLEKQMIIDAGGRKENVFKIILKLFILTGVVSACCVMIFYAL